MECGRKPTKVRIMLDLLSLKINFFLVGGGVSTGVYSNKLYVSDMQSVREIREIARPGIPCW